MSPCCIVYEQHDRIEGAVAAAVAVGCAYRVYMVAQLVPTGAGCAAAEQGDARGQR